MNQLIEIFSANSDKARLITAVLAVISALLVVYLSNWLGSRREKSVVKIEKLEKSFESALKLKETIHDLTDIWGRGKDQEAFFKAAENYKSAMTEFEVYSYIYLPSINKKLDRLRFTVNQFIVEDAFKEENVVIKLNNIAILCEFIENKILEEIKNHL
jgi:hypothetical protein